MLRVSDLHVYYGGIHALKGISLRVKAGQVVTLIGANGAGKTTILRSIVGLAKPRSGSIRFEDREVTQSPSHRTIQLGIGISPEGRRVFPNLTVLENLELGAYNRSPKDLQEALAWVYSLFPRLKERYKQLAGTLSGGEQQMLALGRALMSRPKLVLLDEPSLGLAPLVVEEVFATIQSINRQGATILLVETGRITLEGAGQALLQDERVRHAYLGE
jgi:branched-chain amino acid transport system ATP-binding protein